jgi:chorismate mutase
MPDPASLATPDIVPSAAPGGVSATRPVSLAGLRSEIDRIDTAMHELLMERGQVIEQLIEVKKTQVSGSAFRPGREAEMMRRLALRHKGLLPLDTAEGIWRVIIATFTWVQANYSVHADMSGGDGPMRDSARFHFGFTAPYMPHEDASAVMAAVAQSAGDLGIFRIDQGASAGAWWRGLVGPGAPKIIARLPFIERPDHPAGTPVYVIANPIADAAVREVVLYVARVERWTADMNTALLEALGEVTASAADSSGLSLLIAADGETRVSQLQAALGGADLTEIGSHAARFSAPPRRPA